MLSTTFTLIEWVALAVVILALLHGLAQLVTTDDRRRRVALRRQIRDQRREFRRAFGRWPSRRGDRAVYLGIDPAAGSDRTVTVWHRPDGTLERREVPREPVDAMVIRHLRGRS